MEIICEKSKIKMVHIFINIFKAIFNRNIYKEIKSKDLNTDY